MDAISFEGYKVRQSLIEDTQDKIFFENTMGSEESKKSGYQIAQETFKLSKLMNEGLSKISDESERKRKSDEYYLLLNMIDFLEDKIAKMGGDLKEIYNQMELQQYKEVFTLTIPEIQLLLHVFWKEKQLEWLKQTSMLSKINPFNIFCELITKSEIKFSRNSEYDENNDHDIVLSKSKKIGIYLSLCPYIDLEDFDNELFIDLFYENANNSSCTKRSGFVTKNKKGECCYKFKGKFFPILDYWGNNLIIENENAEIKDDIERIKSITNENIKIRKCISNEIDEYSKKNPYIDGFDLEFKVEFLKVIKEHYESKKFLDVQEMQQISEFQDFVSKFNCEIILNNLRILHNELSMACKNLKYQKK